MLQTFNEAITVVSNGREFHSLKEEGKKECLKEFKWQGGMYTIDGHQLA